MALRDLGMVLGQKWKFLRKERPSYSKQAFLLLKKELFTLAGGAQW